MIAAAWAGMAAATLLVLGTAPPARAPRRLDVRSFGAHGDGVTDDSAALQAALDAARAAGGGEVFLPAGTYLVAPPGHRPGGVTLQWLRIGSRVSLRGEGRRSVLRVRDGVGSYRALLGGDPADGAGLADVTIADLRVDQNCAGSGGDVRVGQDGKEFLVFLAWGGRNVTVERVEFDAVCGVNTVSVNAPTARSLAVRDCRFRFVKGPTTDPTGFYDNSAVYLHGQELSVSGNLFESRPSDGARGAIELHGARGRATGNVTRWYRSCVRLVGTSGAGETPPPDGNALEATGNLCIDAHDAINVWALTGHAVRGVRIAGNTIRLAPAAHQSRDATLQAFLGISLVWDAVTGKLDGDVADVVIEGNEITAARSGEDFRPRAPGASGGIVLVTGGGIDGVVVTGNLVRDVPTRSIHLQSKRSAGGARRVRIEGNAVVDPGTDASDGKLRAGILVAGRLEDVEVTRNAVVGTRTPFRGRWAIRAAPDPGSARVAIHDNAWDAGAPGAAYQVEIPSDAGDGAAAGPARAVVAPPEGGARLALDVAGVRLWDVTVLGAGGLQLDCPPAATTGQRLTVRVRNLHRSAPGRVTWQGVEAGDWRMPPPGATADLELEWDGRSWRHRG